MARKVSEHIYLIDTLALGYREMTAAYLVAGKDDFALVDPGYSSSFQRVVEELEEIGIKPQEVRYLVPTHLHLDHSGAVSAFIKSFKRSTVLCHPRAVKHFLDPSRLIASVLELYGDDEVRLFGPVDPVPSENIRGVQDYERLDLGGVTLRFIHAPGHAPHQIAVYVEEDHALITGDSVSIQHPSSPVKIPTTPPPSYDHEEAIRTLEKLSRTSPRIILRPHFGETVYTPGFFEDEAKTLQEWKEDIEPLVRNGLSLEKIMDHLLRGKYASFRELFKILPPLHGSARLSALGMMKYLEGKR